MIPLADVNALYAAGFRAGESLMNVTWGGAPGGDVGQLCGDGYKLLDLLRPIMDKLAAQHGAELDGDVGKYLKRRAG